MKKRIKSGINWEGLNPLDTPHHQGRGLAQKEENQYKKKKRMKGGVS